MSARDLRPFWQNELRQLEERISVLKAKIEAADEMFSAPQKEEEQLPFQPAGHPIFSISKTVENIIKDHGIEPGLSIDEIRGKFYLYGTRPENVKRTTIYTLANRLATKGVVKKTGRATFAKIDSQDFQPEIEL